MRGHADIVRAFGASVLQRRLAERGVNLGPGTPQRWADRNSIPATYWAELVKLGAASLEELMGTAQDGGRSDHVDDRRMREGVAENSRPFRHDASAPAPEVRERMKRRAALEAFLAVAEQGRWRSDGPYGSRDELYDR